MHLAVGDAGAGGDLAAAEAGGGVELLARVSHLHVALLLLESRGTVDDSGGHVSQPTDAYTANCRLNANPDKGNQIALSFAEGLLKSEQ